MAFSAKEAHRAATFQKKRQKEQEDLQIKKKKIEEELQVGSISNKFSAHYDAIEQQLKSDTVGKLILCASVIQIGLWVIIVPSSNIRKLWARFVFYFFLKLHWTHGRGGVL